MRYVFIIAAIVTSALAAGCSSSPPEMTVNGTVQVADKPTEGVYPPVDVGSQVTVTDPFGTVIGSGTLNGNAKQGPVFTLTFGFTVKVPEGESSYGITVAGLTGTAQYTPAQMRQGPAVCADTACGG